MTDFNDLAQRAFETNEKSGFNELAQLEGDIARDNYIGSKLMLVVGEASEAQEEIRAGHGYTEIYYVTAGGTDGQVVHYGDDSGVQWDNEYFIEHPMKPEGFPIELADVVIRAMAIAGEAGIDLNAAIELKQAYNATRPYKHGRKF